jgi:SNF2 family DNA or RNA helicase
MTPYEAVREEFDFPFELYPFQAETINRLTQYDRAGLYHEAGAGKTATSTHMALHATLTKGTQKWLVIMPPILLQQWARWLRSIKDKRTGQPLSVTIYAGTPAQRRKLDMSSRFILLSYGLLRNDLEALTSHTNAFRCGVICDEAHAIKNVASQTHRAVRELSQDRPLVLLTGTPLTKPIDGYAYIRFVAPGIYRNFRQFEQIHIKETDEYGTVTQWDNLELLADNMKIHTSRILRRDAQAELPPITFTTLVYDLAPAHMKLYERIAQEKLVEFEDGREINAISTQALYSALQQVVMNWAHFEDDPTREPAGLELIDEVFDEIGPSAKLAVVANFIRTNDYLVQKLQKYGVVAIYGGISAKAKQAAIARFIEDPTCRCILLQPASAGFGVDGLQHVCSDMLILEAPTTAPPFQQVTARLDRDGQKSPVNCRIGIANKTIQVRMFKKLLSNDETINAIQGGHQDLREAIYGE